MFGVAGARPMQALHMNFFLEMRARSTRCTGEKPAPLPCRVRFRYNSCSVNDGALLACSYGPPADGLRQQSTSQRERDHRKNVRSWPTPVLPFSNWARIPGNH